MSQLVVNAVIRASASTSSWSSPTRTALARATICPLSSASPSPSLVRFKSKKNKASLASNVDEPRADNDDVPVLKTKGKGKSDFSSGAPRGARSKRGGKEQAQVEDSGNFRHSTKNDELPGEVFRLDATEKEIKQTVDQCKSSVNQMVGMQGRADPSLLDRARVRYGDDGEEYPLRDFASVGTKDGALIVTLYDSSMLKHVERAIYLAELGLTPQQVGSGHEAVLRIPVPRPTSETRAKLLQDVNRICENCRVSVRSIRHQAQKQIKGDVKSGTIGEDEGFRKLKAVDETAMKSTREVDDLQAGLKKKIEKEDA